MKIRKLNRYENGQKTKSEKFYAVFADQGGVIRRLPLFEDRKASEEAGRKVDKLVDLRAANDTIPEELTRFIETTTPFIRAKLAEYGIIATTKLAASKPLVEHIADWKKALLSKGNTPRHAELVTSRAEKVLNACGFTFWSDITASRVQSYLHDLREDKEGQRGISAQTHNFYLQAVKQFARWMVRDGRVTQSPLVHLQGLNVKTDRRHDRRALSADELRWLIETTKTNGTRAGITGEERAVLYRLAAETGLRAGEIRSLTSGSFNLEGEEPSVTVAAAYSKNRREAVQPLPLSLVPTLREHLKNKLPAAPALNMPKPNMLPRILRTDLKVARNGWIEDGKSDEEKGKRAGTNFLSYRDEAGRVADFHAFRHTYISNLVAGGVHPKTAQRLARHGTIGLTMDRYTHVYQGDLTAALKTLPDLATPIKRPLRKTGTTDTEG